jgi:predicted amidophosphoribosyltransferase
MELKTCPNCQKPYLATAARCPRCPEEVNHDWDQDSWANVGCFVLMILFVFFMVLVSLLSIAGMFIRF